MIQPVFNLILNKPEIKDWLKHKAHDWLPAYFSRYELTPEENLLIDQKNALQAALVDKNPEKLTEVLDLFPNLINQPLNNGEVSITFAVKQNLHDKIDLLLERGADPMCKDRAGLNALDIALQKKDKQLFAKLIGNKLSTIAQPKEFIDSLDSVIVTGSTAKKELNRIEAEATATRQELGKSKELSGEYKKLFETILKGDFVQFKSLATSEKISVISEKIGNEKLLNAAILGSPLVLNTMLTMGFQPPNFSKYHSSEHPMRFAYCSRHPIEAYVPLFEKLNFDVHSIASTSEGVRYFDLLVYQKKRNAENMDPLAVTVWDIAFAAFSLLSFVGNYQYLPVSQNVTPYIRLGLNVANYVQAISLLLFKVSYSHEGKIGAAIEQLMTHYIVSLFLPVRLYYAFMTVYSSWKTCLDHKYRSYKDLCKKMIVQLPATAEIVHHVTDVVTPYFKTFFNRLFGRVETETYNWNATPPSSTKETKSENSSELAQTAPGPLLENTEFMKKFGESVDPTVNASNKETGLSNGNTGNGGIAGQMFNDDKWLYQNQTPEKRTLVIGAVELGKDFHTDAEWYRNTIKGTPLETHYRNMHLQAAGAARIDEYRDGFSFQGAVRVDFTGMSALQHFVETIIEGGAHFEAINNRPTSLALPSNSN